VDGSAERQSWEADVACPEQKGAEVLQQQQHASHDTSQQWQQNQRQHHLQQHLEGQGPQQHRHLQEQVVVVVQDQSLEEEANEQQQQQEQQQGAATSASADLLLDVHSPTPVSLSHAGASAFSPVAPSGAAGAGRPLAVSPTGAGPGSSRAGSGAAYELFVRLKCARQTLEFATRQAEVRQQPATCSLFNGFCSIEVLSTQLYFAPIAQLLLWSGHAGLQRYVIYSFALLS
jgi:hypothetical protein